jgi:hypothetical protein
MKLKKEYVGLVVIIAALVLYLSLKDNNKTHYSLPSIEPVEKSEISKIIIGTPDTIITLIEQDNNWKLIPQNHKADKQKVDRFLNEFSNFTLTAMVSESKLYSHYGLDDDSKISVQAYSDGNIKRDFYIGKTASTNRHSFVMFKDNTKVYEAKNNIRNIFDTTIDELRDKGVLSFETTEITKLSVTSGDKSIEFVKSAVPQPVTPGKQEDKAPQPPEIIWKTTDDKIAKTETIKRIFNTLSKLQCSGYIEGKTKSDFTDPVYTITVEGNETYSVAIFQKQDDKQYPAISSGSDYPFLLPEWKAEQIMKKPEEIVAE